MLSTDRLRDSIEVRWRRYSTCVAGSRLHLSWMAFWSFVGLASTLVAPLLLGLPVVLMALAPRLVFVTLAAPQLDLFSFVALGTIRLSVTDPSYFIVGRRAALSAAAFPFAAPSGFLARSAKWLISLITRSRLLAATVLFLRPNSRYLAIAGWHKVPGWLAGSSAAIGTMVYLAALHSGVSLLF